MTRLWDQDVDAEHIRNRGMLQAPDHVIWRLAADERRTIVTINGRDFRRLALATDRHHGIVVIPSGRNPDGQFDLIMTAVSWANRSNSGFGFANRYVEIGDDGRIAIAEIACRDDAN